MQSRKIETDTVSAAGDCIRELLWDCVQLWWHALAWAAENVLAGFAGIRGRCTMMGRAAMSLDLQQVRLSTACHPLFARPFVPLSSRRRLGQDK